MRREIQNPELFGTQVRFSAQQSTLVNPDILIRAAELYKKTSAEEEQEKEEQD
jgi:hypothetical protein